MEPSQRSISLRYRCGVFVAVLLPLLAVFVATGNRTFEPVDPFTNTLTAWSIASSGTPVLAEHEVLRYTRAWIVNSDQGPVAQYPPGAALVAAPAYAVFGREAPAAPITILEGGGPVEVRVPLPSPAIGATVAAVVTASAMGVLALLILELGGSGIAAVTAGLVAGTATSAWTVAGDALWQHGPNMLWISLALVAGVHGRWMLAGFAFSAVALTRPPVLLIGAVIGVWLLGRGDLRSAVRLLVGTSPGLAAMLVYNAVVFGAPSVSGGYPTDLVGGAVDRGVGWYVANLASAFVDADFGVFTWSPVVLIASIGAAIAWQGTPGWARVAAVGGLAYLLLQLALNGARGGYGFQYYRYPLETLMACAPVLYSGWRRLWVEGPLARVALTSTAAYSIVVHAVVAIR